MEKVAVVFVHGFTGGSDTWKNSLGQSFTTLLCSDSDLDSSYDFYEFEYFTELFGLFNSGMLQELLSKLPFIEKLGYKKKVKSNLPMARLSKSLDSYMRIHLSEYEEVIIIAHSMGGIISKEYILNYEDSLGPKPVGFISLAVPHKGSIQSYILSPTLNPNARELRPLGEHLNIVNDEWTDRKTNLPDSIYVTAQHDQYVNSVSSEPYKLTKKQQFFVDKDHNTICKPESIKDDCYIVVANFLKKKQYTKNMNDISNIPYDPDNNYDKEIFVIKMILGKIQEKGVDDAKESFFQAEIVSKAADKKDRLLLSQLQTKVLSLYRQSYTSCSKKSANEIFTAVHDKLLQQDEFVLKTAINYINFMHKKGLLHQIANNLSTSVIWSDDTTVDKIMEELK